MKQHIVKDILDITTDFAKSNNQILAVGLCGSYARGDAIPDSDLDLLILVKDKLAFKRMDWMPEVQFEKIEEEVECFKDAIYGQVWSRHIFLKNGFEIEFCFANKSWANIKNLDEGTRKVVLDGFRTIYDPQHILNKLMNKVKSDGKPRKSKSNRL